MAVRNEFVDHVGELLAPAGHVVTKRMFSGHGVYIDGLFVAIVAWDELYLKTDDNTRAAFDAESCKAFVYSKDGRQMTMNYRRAPDEAMDAPHLMLPWARRAIEAALRARAVKAARVKSTAKATPKKKTTAKAKPSQPLARKRRSK